MKRSKFSLSHYKLTTMKMGKLYPVGCVEVTPGDTFQHQTSALVRLSPLVAPTMHPVQVRIHHWFVPYRLLWNEWENFITGKDPLLEGQIPALTTSGAGKDLFDYMGIPNKSGIDVNALPFRAYNKIWNEFYRDEDLQTEIDEETNTAIQNVSWGKDYFTDARPWPQKGPDITIPLGNTADVRWHSDNSSIEGAIAGGRQSSESSSTGNFEYNQTSFPNATRGTLYTDLSSATGANINDVRTAFALQRYQEARARYGSRYTEYLRYLGINPSDARLQRPEYLGGGRQTIAFSEVLQTGEGTDPVGTLRGHGISAMRSNKYRRFFEEHGVVLSLMSIRPKNIYTDGIRRQFLKFTKEDYYQKELEHIGQQPIYQNEVYADSSHDYADVFGYQDRYREYREHPSQVSGEFRNSLNYWHLGRSFAQSPVLNGDFVKCQPSDRIFADQTGNDTFQIMVNHNLKARRIIKRNAQPRLV
jgi:hypothetical protein